jgi:2-oxoglutarate dehydrogenase E2 component (dihydrolipoamide succinyltransferase)
MAELIDIVLPEDQSEGTSNTVGKWFKAVGDPVRKDDPLLEIVTDKVTVEIAAPSDGVLVEVLKPEGDSVEPGTIVGRLGAPGAVPVQTSKAPAVARNADAARAGAGTSEAEAISPAVRRLLLQHGLDAGSIKGSGRGGRITVQDVEDAVAAGSGGAGADAATGPSRRVPHSVVRKSIAAHMVKSVATAPHVTTVFEADLSAVVAHRNANKTAFTAQGVPLTFTAYFVRATVAALKAVPEVNSRWHDDALELFDDCNIGIAAALPAGLIVPVIAKAQDLDLLATAKVLHDLTERARAGKLEPREVHGGTFTISNHGVSGSLVATPIIINQPQSAILGVGKMEERVKVDSAGGFRARPCAYVTLTIDHRVLDGAQANAFLTAWTAYIAAGSY